MWREEEEEEEEEEGMGHASPVTESRTLLLDGKRTACQILCWCQRWGWVRLYRCFTHHRITLGTLCARGLR